MLKLLEALPLILFVFLARRMDAGDPMAWQWPFMAGGVAGFGVLVLFLWKKEIFNRLFLGIHIYLILGGLGFAAEQWWFTQFYGALGPAGMLLAMLFTGGVATLVSPLGFTGLDLTAHDQRRYSLGLLGATILAFGLSLGFKENLVLSQVIPFMGLFLVLGQLRRRALAT